MRPVTFILSLILSLSLLAGCGGGSPDHSPSPQDRTETYRSAIEGARDQELNSAYPRGHRCAAGHGPGGLRPAGAGGRRLPGLRPVGVPDEREGLRHRRRLPLPRKGGHGVQRSGGLHHPAGAELPAQYLADQYDIASHARLDTLADGTVLLVMCEDQDEVFNSIRDAIEETSNSAQGRVDHAPLRTVSSVSKKITWREGFVFLRKSHPFCHAKCHFRGRSVKKMCRWHIFSVGRTAMLCGKGRCPRERRILIWLLRCGRRNSAGLFLTEGFRPARGTGPGSPRTRRRGHPPASLPVSDPTRRGQRSLTRIVIADDRVADADQIPSERLS